MANKVVNTMVLFLTLMIIGTTIASPIAHPKKSFGNILLNIALKSVNNNSPNNLSYRSGTLLEAKKISTGNDLPVLKVSVQLQPVCTEELQCPEEMCDMLIKQDESNHLIVDDNSKVCYVKNELISNQLDNRFKREVPEVDLNNKWLKLFVSQAAADFILDCRNSNDNCTWSHFDRNGVKIINATYVEGLTPTYKVHFNLTKSICVETAPLQRNCSYDDDSTILCKVDIIKALAMRHKIYLRTTCENKTVNSHWY